MGIARGAEFKFSLRILRFAAAKKTMHSLSFAAQVTDLPGLSDSEFLKSLTWDRTASAAIRAAAANGDIGRFCRTWQAEHRSLESSAVSAASCGGRVLWSGPSYPEEAGLASVISQTTESLSKKSPKKAHRPVNKPAASGWSRVSQLVNELTDAVCSEEPRPLAVLASLELLAHSGHRLASDQFFKLWRSTLSELLMWPTVIYEDPTVPADNLLVEHGEIPLVGGLVFRFIANASNLVKSGRKVLAKELIDRTDTDGTPHAEILPRLPLWLAPLVRSTSLMDRYETGRWTGEQRQRLSNIIDRAILTCRPNGRAALSNGQNLDALPVLVAAVELTDLELMSSTGDYLRAVQRAVAGKTSRRSRPLVNAMSSNQSDWARFAHLRSDLSVESDSVAITHHQPFPQLDVVAMGRPLIHGDWKLKLKMGDATVELAEEWSCVCWESDPDADYIELQMAGPGGLRVERMVMLSRKERFLIMADAISGASDVSSSVQLVSDSDKTNQSSRRAANQRKPRIEYESRLPFCEGLVGTCEGVTREAVISGKRLKARLFPLGLPQDRVNSTAHNISIEGHEVVLKHVVEGEGLMAPLVLVWHPDRTRVDAQWRTLTVAEEGKVVGPDIAAGFRLKLGGYQLLICRALKKTGNSRTCLGYHTYNETVIGHFDKNGNVDPILMIE